MPEEIIICENNTKTSYKRTNKAAEDTFGARLCAQTRGSWVGEILERLDTARAGRTTFIMRGTCIPTQSTPLSASHTQKQMTS